MVNSWTEAEVEARLIRAFKVDALSPRLRGPKAPGNDHPDVEYSRAERDQRNKWEIAEKREPRETLTRDDVRLADEAFTWLTWIARASAQSRETFHAWLRCKAKGYGALQVWQCKHGVANGSVLHARKSCAGIIVDRLNRQVMTLKAA